MTAARMNNGKPELGYLLQFPTAIEAFARVKMLGAAKYDRGNWKLGGKPDYEYLDACLRHLTAFVSGEYYAQDSGCPHLAHAAWNLFALQELNYTGQSHDPELFDKMIEYWTKKKEEAQEAASSKPPLVPPGQPMPFLLNGSHLERFGTLANILRDAVREESLAANAGETLRPSPVRAAVDAVMAELRRSE